LFHNATSRFVTRTEPPFVSGDIPALVFVNRAAGRGRTHLYLPRIRDLFQSLDLSAQFVETGSASELETAARQAAKEKHRVLLAMGGDGTFQALANGAFGSNVIIGILPAGGGNDFAAALGLPTDLLRSVEIALKGRPRFIDLVRATTADGRTRLYAGGGGIGLDAEAVLIASGAYRKLPGRFRYIASALRALSKHLPLRVRLEFPGADIDPAEIKCLLTAVLNTPTYGGGVRLAPEASPDDGWLDVISIGDLSGWEVVKLLPPLMRSGELCTPKVQRWKVKSVKISADHPCLFHGDGEILGPTPVEIDVVPGAVRVLAPESRNSDHPAKN
jgi:diacylglycerol kinase (ATP)